MGDVGVFVIYATIALITALSLILGFVSYKNYKMKNQFDEDEMLIRYIMLLKEAEKKLNVALKIHEHRLDHHRDDIYGIQRRLDILEANHPDDEIDYGTVDDDGNITEVWFEGKRYVPEDKRDEDAIKIYADNKVMTETTRPEEKRCCATCRHYLPGLDHTCTIRPWLHVEEAYANNTHSACNNWKKVYTPTKGQVDYPYITYEYMSGNCKAEETTKRLDALQYKIQELNFAMFYANPTAHEWRRRWEELMQNDT